MACECELQNTLDVEVTQDALLDMEIGGSAGVLLQKKSVEVTDNGTSVVAPDDGFDGLKIVEINTNVPKRFECGDGYFIPPASGATSISLIGLLQKIDVSCWDTSKVTNMNSMFKGFSSLQYLDVSSWDTSKVTNIREIFRNCSSLKTINLSSWDVHGTNDYSFLFYHCASLETVDLSYWNTSNVIYSGRMFEGCTLLKYIDISGWDFSNNIGNGFQFYLCGALRTLIGDHTLQDVEDGLKTMIGLKLSIETKYSPLRFSSILALANGLADLTGKTAQTLTISASSYNNMYNDDDTTPSADVIAERQARIAAICAAKNWDFAH